jgi:DNA gyrase subunit A
MEIKKILDELKEKKAEAERIEGILRSEKKLWGVVKDELNEVGEKYGDRRARGWIIGGRAGLRPRSVHCPREHERGPHARRVDQPRRLLASIETTRVREGDEVAAVVPEAL